VDYVLLDTLSIQSSPKGFVQKREAKKFMVQETPSIVFLWFSQSVPPAHMEFNGCSSAKPEESRYDSSNLGRDG